jgi:hypothetical protein
MSGVDYDNGINNRTDDPTRRQTFQALAREYWEKHFGNQMVVWADEAISTIQASAGCDIGPLAGELLTTESVDRMVTIVQFMRLCAWFGPFYDPADAPTLVPIAARILGSSWFKSYLLDDAHAHTLCRQYATQNRFFIRPNANADTMWQIPFFVEYSQWNIPSRIFYLDMNTNEKVYFVMDRVTKFTDLSELVAHVQFRGDATPL